jgi:hypothetical protein
MERQCGKRTMVGAGHGPLLQLKEITKRRATKLRIRAQDGRSRLLVI